MCLHLHRASIKWEIIIPSRLKTFWMKPTKWTLEFRWSIGSTQRFENFMSCRLWIILHCCLHSCFNLFDILWQALRNNPKISVVEGDKYEYKPKFTIRGKESLRRLLEKRYVKGQGGLLMEDVEESLPNAQKAIKVTIYLSKELTKLGLAAWSCKSLFFITFVFCLQLLGDQILQVTRPNDKKVVLFFNDKSTAFTVNEGKFLISEWPISNKTLSMFHLSWFRRVAEIVACCGSGRCGWQEDGGISKEAWSLIHEGLKYETCSMYCSSLSCFHRCHGAFL